MLFLSSHLPFPHPSRCTGFSPLATLVFTARLLDTDGGGRAAGPHFAAASLEQQAAQLGLGDGGSLQQQVAAALGQAAAEDWCGVEALLQQALECSAAIYSITYKQQQQRTREA